MLVDKTDANVWDRLFGKYSYAFLDHAHQPWNVGSMDEANIHVKVTGLCEDTIEIWLKEKAGRIEKISFIPEGCEGTVACGSAMTELAKNMSLEEAAGISAASIEQILGGLAEEHKHCAQLAAAALYRALAESIREIKRKEKE